MIKREQLKSKIKIALKRSRCVALLGPRQCGKTTIARVVSDEMPSTFLDMEDPESSARLTNPKMALESLKGLVVLDEIQMRPDLFPVLRVLLDREPLPAKFLILGSASPELIEHTSETLAGRVEFIDMSGFSLAEVGDENIRQLWLQGCFPPSYLAGNEDDSFIWRRDFVRTFLERDIHRLGFNIPPETLRRFFIMLSHYHGQLWNASRIAASLDLTAPTMKRYLDILTGTYLIRQIPPWFENIGKRLVKSPKIYFRDTGILHYVSNIRTMGELETHPLYGASWEGFVIEEIIRKTNNRNLYFWRTQAGAELDLLLPNGGRKIGIEVKCTETPKVTKSMRIAMSDLNLTHLYIVYPGNATFPIEEKITALSINNLPEHWNFE